MKKIISIIAISILFSHCMAQYNWIAMTPTFIPPLTTPIAFSRIQFAEGINSNKGYFSSEYEFAGIYRTNDGGSSWQKLDFSIIEKPGSPNILNKTSFFFNNSGEIGIAVASDGKIRRTLNSGNNWSLPTNSTVALWSCWTDGTIGIIVGDNGTILICNDILATTLSWQQVNSGTSSILNTVYGIKLTNNTYRIIIGGNDGVILKNVNGTLNSWQIKPCSLSTQFMSCKLSSCEDNVGYLAGTNGYVYKTIDGGETWVPELVNSLYKLVDVDISEPIFNGAVYVIGNNRNYPFDGRIFKKMKNENQWQMENGFSSSKHLYDIDFNNSAGYLGNSTTLYKLQPGKHPKSTSTTGQLIEDKNNLKTSLGNLSESSIYDFAGPSVNDVTFSYSVKEQGHVTIKLYDLMGKLVRVIVDEQKELGNYSIILHTNDLQKEMYVYKYCIGNKCQTKKLIIN